MAASAQAVAAQLGQGDSVMYAATAIGQAVQMTGTAMQEDTVAYGQATMTGDSMTPSNLVGDEE